MITISLCATKGGTGKSTVCVHLATHVSTLGKKVAILDLDAGQGSATAWMAQRGDVPGPRLAKVRSLSPDLRRLAAQGFDFALIDSPPTLDDAGIVEAAVRVADFVISPCRPSILEIGAAAIVGDLAGDKPLGFLMTDVTPAWKSTNTGAAKALADVGHVFTAHLTHRHAYVANVAAGRVAGDTDKTAAAEVAELWREVAKWMKS